MSKKKKKNKSKNNVNLQAKEKNNIVKEENKLDNKKNNNNSKVNKKFAKIEKNNIGKEKNRGANKKSMKAEKKPNKIMQIIKRKEHKEKEQSDSKELIKKKEKKISKMIQTIKKRWLISSTKTIMLMIILVLIFIILTNWLHKLRLDPIDLTASKVYSLTKETKERIKDIDEQVNIYFIGIEDTDFAATARLYNNVNKNINVEEAKAEERPDLVQKYGIDDINQGIIIECGERSKVLTTLDLLTYDNSYNEINLTEGALTAAILTVTSDYIPNVYFLKGYSDFDLSSNMVMLSMYLQNEVMNIKELDLLVEENIPEDCDTIIINTPSKDFEDIVTEKIINYINNGGKILWFNGYQENTNFPNVEKILNIYGVNKFESGIIWETDITKMFQATPYAIIPEVQRTEITENIVNDEGVMLLDAGKINVKSYEELEAMGVSRTDLLTSSEKAFFRKDQTNTSYTKTENEEEGEFLIAAMFTKTISDGSNTEQNNTEQSDTDQNSTEENKEEDENAKKSTLILIAENYFASDFPIVQNSQSMWISVYNNKDLVLNSMAYLANREQDITIRKPITTIYYTSTEQQNKIVVITIFAVPVLIMLFGIIVWQVRRRKK